MFRPKFGNKRKRTARGSGGRNGKYSSNVIHDSSVFKKSATLFSRNEGEGNSQAQDQYGGVRVFSEAKRHTDGTIQGRAIGGLVRNPERCYGTQHGLDYAKISPCMQYEKRIIKKAVAKERKKERQIKKKRKVIEKKLHGSGWENEDPEKKELKKITRRKNRNRKKYTMQVSTEEKKKEE